MLQTKYKPLFSGIKQSYQKDCHLKNIICLDGFRSVCHKNLCARPPVACRSALPLATIGTQER